MSTNLGKTEAPAAARATKAGWRDARLWIGVALVAVSVLVGARLLGGADDTVEVWAAAHDLPQGSPVTEDDLVVHRVRFEDGEDRYLQVGEELPGDGVLLRDLGEGELLPAAALGEPESDLEQVSFAVERSAVPPGVRPGAVVTVWVTPDSGGKAKAERVIEDVVVVAVPEGDSSLGPSGARQVVIGVGEDQSERIGAVLRAANADQISITSQG